MILKRKLYSEAGKKKLEERAKKKSNKRKWQLNQAREASDYSWKRGLFDSEFGEKHAERKKWLKGKTNEEVLDAIDKKPVKVTKHKGFLGDTTERSYNLPKSVVKEMELGEEALRTGRKSIENQGTKYWGLAKAKEFKIPNRLMIDISSGKAGTLGEHKLDMIRELDLNHELRARKDRLKKIEEEKAKEIAKAARKTKIRKAAPWVIGGTAIAGATAAGIKIAKKKKAKKEDNNRQ